MEEPNPELEDCYSGSVSDVNWIDDDNGVIMTALRFESESGEDLGWITSTVHFCCADALELWLIKEPKFLASEIGDDFVIQVQGLEARLR